ncbi:MAG: PAS domain S-box protein [Verrucomicrobiota bacterium]|jgi:PAS domain S-box-containing protein
MPKLLRILIVEDSEDDAFFTVQELARGGFNPEFERVQTLAALASALDRQLWDVIICDHSMPGFTSFEALQLIKQRQCDTPFIIVSGVIGEETAVKAMKAGASDYVMKNGLARLVPSLERELVEASNRRILRQAEKALRRSQHDLNDFFENAPISLHWAAADGTILRINAAELKLLGCAPEDCLGHSVAEFFYDVEVAEDALQQLRGGESLVDYPARLRCRDGAVKEGLICANALWDDGKFVRSRWFTLDVTDRMHYELISGYLGSIVESTEDAIIGTDLKGNIVSWNEGATRLYGYAAAEARGRSILMLTPPNRVEESPEHFTRILREQQVDRYETIHLPKEGAVIPVSVTRSPIRDSQGKIIGVSAIERDITQRKQEEQERLLLIQELSRALARVKTLRGLVPICASCKKIRDDRGDWNQIESFLQAHTQAEFTPALCPECEAQVI